MLNGIQRLFNRTEQLREEEQDEYTLYAQEVEATLRHLEAHLHDSDDSDEIIVRNVGEITKVQGNICILYIFLILNVVYYYRVS